MLVMVAPHAHAVARHHLLGGLDGLPIYLDVPSAHGRRGRGSGFKHAHGPHPGINPDGAAARLRCRHLVLVVVFVDDLLDLKPVIAATNHGDDGAHQHPGPETSR